MSEKEQDTILGQTFRELEERKKRLARYQAKSRNLADRLKRASDAMTVASRANAPLRSIDEAFAAVEDCPRNDELEETYSGIRRNHNLVDKLEERLQKMVPSWRPS